MRFLACDVRTTNITLPVGTDLRIDWDVASSSNDQWSGSKIWRNWSLPNPPVPTNPILSSVCVPGCFLVLGSNMLPQVGEFGGLSPSSEHVQSFCVGNTGTWNHNLSLLETYVVRSQA